MRKIWGAFVAWVVARFEGATFSTSRSIIQAGYQSARFDASASARAELVRKSRYFERNNPIMQRACDIFETYTVGCNVQVMPASSNRKWNAAAKESLDLFFRFPAMDSLQDMTCIASLIARTWLVDGEVFIVKTKGESGRPRIQLIEGHRVQTPHWMAKQEGVSVVDGVNIDPNGRPNGYWIGEEDEKGNLSWPRGMTSAEQVVHVFEPSRAGQYRGLPFCYSVINILHDMDDLHILEMAAAKEAARVTNVVLNKAGEFNPAGAMRSAIQLGRTNSAGGSSTDTTYENYRQVLGANSIALKTGEDIKQFKTERPNVVTMEYWRYMSELFCSGLGIPYVLVFPDSMQGTVYRGTLDMANSFFRSRHGVIAAALRNICEFYLRWASSNEPALRDKPGDWFKMDIYWPRAVNVDVGRNMQAELSALAAGATNYELLYSPLGLDWRDQFDKLAEQQKYAESIGLKLAVGPNPTDPNAPDPKAAPPPPVKKTPQPAY